MPRSRPARRSTYCAVTDWPHNNCVVARERSPAGRRRFYTWDAESGMMAGQIRTNFFTTRLLASGNYSNNVPSTVLYTRLKPSAEFRLLFADRIHRHFFNGGALTNANFAGKWSELATEFQSLLREVSGDSTLTVPDNTARWINGVGDPTRYTLSGGTSGSIVNEPHRRGVLLDGYFNDTSGGAFVQGHFVSEGLWPATKAPQFSQHGGNVAPGFTLTVTNPIPDGTIIPAGGHLAIGDGLFGAAFGLGQNGDSAWVFSAAPGGALTGWAHGFGFGASDAGVSFGRHVNSAGVEKFAPQTATSANAANAGPRTGPLVVTKIIHTPAPADDAYVAIRNISASSVPLFDPVNPANTHRVTAIAFDFPQGTTLAPGQFAIISRAAPAAFRVKYSVPAAVPVFGPYPGVLSATGELVGIQKPGVPFLNNSGVPTVPRIAMDAVEYSALAPWPAGVPGIERIIHTAFGDDPANWRAAASPPGLPPPLTWPQWQQTFFTPALTLQWSSAGIAKQPVPDAPFLRYDAAATTPPAATDDHAATRRDTPVSIPVLVNDSDDGMPQPLAISAVTQPRAGTAVVAGNAIHYSPAAGFLGEDSFQYTITDGAASATATVRVSVTYFDGEYWFPFNQATGLLAQEAGGEMSGVLNGFTSQTAQWVAGKFGRGLQFDNVDDHVTIAGFNGITGTGARTCAAWVRTTASGNDPIIAWGPNTNGAKWTFLMNSAGQIRVEITSGFAVGTRTVNDGQWHHVACTFENDGTPDAADIQLYVDGTPDPPTTVTPLAIHTGTSGNVKIGSDVQSRFWSGTLDEVRIYPRALSPAEIAALAAPAQEQTAAAWARRHFGSAPVDWLADSEADSMSHLAEFALGGQPHIPDAAGVLPSLAGDGPVIFSFRRRISDTSALTYTPQHSPGLPSWFTLATPAPEILPAADPAFEIVKFTRTPAPGEHRSFRVRITNP